MARSRVSINPLYRGGAGGYSFYVRDGEQVVRQRKNNSNYGESASRTYSQMIRRIKWGNLVNVYKLLKSWQQKAYEGKKKGQTDYNIFMQLNTNRTHVAFTKEMNEAGCEIFEQFQVSKGTLPSIACTFDDDDDSYITDIAYNGSITSSTTLGAFSAAIIAANPVIQNGDNLAFILLYNWEEPRTEFPHGRSVYQEITLDTSSTALLSSVAAIGSRISVNDDDVLCISYDPSTSIYQNREVGIVVIRTRKESGLLRVSSQSIVLNSTSLITPYTSDDWYEQCIASFGLTQDVPLDPNFKVAPVDNVTIDGAALYPGERINGSQIMRISTAEDSNVVYDVYINGVKVINLRSGDDYNDYLLNSNGNVTIYRDNGVYLSFTIAGISEDWGIPCNMMIGQTDSLVPDVDPSSLKNKKDYTAVNCALYPYMYDSDDPRFKYVCYVMNMIKEDFSFVNCSSSTWAAGQGYQTAGGIVMLTDTTSIARITYRGKTIVVFNYQ